MYPGAGIGNRSGAMAIYITQAFCRICFVPQALVDIRGALSGLQWLSGGWNIHTHFPLQNPMIL